MLPSIATKSFTRRQALSLFGACLGGCLLAPRAFADNRFTFGKDIDGKDVTSLAASGGRYLAAIFVATDCPISNRYLPLIARMSEQFAPRQVCFWLVYPNPGDTLATVRTHQARYPAAASLPQLIAPDSRFLAHSHVHVTPEAAVFPADSIMTQPVLWHGRIDDRYLTFGSQRPAATRHDLADALDAVLAGRQPAMASAPPVGCAIIPRS